MKLREFSNANDFLDIAGPSMRREEAANQLILGIVERLKKEPHAYGDQQPFLSVVEEGQQLLAAGVMTPPYNVLIYSDGEMPNVEAYQVLAKHLIDKETVPPGVMGRKEDVRVFCDIWKNTTGMDCKLLMDQRTYELREVLSPQNVAGQMHPAREEDLELIYAWSDGFHAEAMGEAEARDSRKIADDLFNSGDVFIWVDEKPVSMAAKRRPFGKGICVSFVYTPPESRRKGYASALVAALSQHLLDKGYEYCTLFTDLSNPTSNAIYQEIGYRPLCDFLNVKFEKGE